MGCPQSLAALQSIAGNIEVMKQIALSPHAIQSASASMLYDTSCSTIGTTRKGLLADDTGLPPSSKFSRLTLKVRSMGTNSYIAVGASATPAFRFTGVSQSITYPAPIVNGSVAPFIGDNIIVIGDGANGVLEITGIRISEVE